MLIITADDYGKSRYATDSILECFTKQRITSASAMVFMEDSERAAAISLDTSLEIGLHLNFTQPFTDNNISLKLREHQTRIISYLTSNKFAQAIYNPFLNGSFKFLFRFQYREFIRLYGRPPDFINGHHHMHLCTNILAARLIPRNTRLRGTFTFSPGEKDFFNFFYRRIIERWISRRYISTDSFFSIEPVSNIERLQNIFNRAIKQNVEIEVHPEYPDQFEFLLSDQYRDLLDSTPIGRFRNL